MNQLAYMEMIDFIAAGATSRQVADFRPSAATQQRATDLLAKAKDGTLTDDEKSELDSYVELEKVLSLAKARARQMLAKAG
jgi:hypothetical protein